MKAGDIVETPQEEVGTIVGIGTGRYPYIVRVFRNQIAYLSDYSKRQLKRRG